MSPAPINNRTAPTLIRAYHEATHKQRVANHILTISILLTVLIFVFLIWSQFTRFLDHDLTEFSANLGVEATEFMPTVVDRIDEMTSRLIPVYIENFREVLQRDEPKFLEILNQEFCALESHAVNVARPQIEEALAQLIVN